MTKTLLFMLLSAGPVQYILHSWAFYGHNLIEVIR